MLYGDFVLDISFLQTILFALFAILTLFRDDYIGVSEIAKSRRANNSVPHFLWVVQHNVGSLQSKDERP
ncbi:Uncharacterized protein XB16_2527 [Leptospira santarosai]|uniref:Uncharacterized protein n=1 Tax=Leptospira santarosai TaxID=28183 RepID=A0A2P1QVA0_9LEPT|nr:Uncharacterized protein XB16_2527 [Leptospira santarosai]